MSSNLTWKEQVEARQRVLEPVVQRAIDRVRASVVSCSPAITDALFYGAIGIDPKHLAIWYIFATDTQKKSAKASGVLEELDRGTRDALREEGYSSAVLAQIGVSFASDEEIHRAGGFRSFFA